MRRALILFGVLISGCVGELWTGSQPGATRAPAPNARPVAPPVVVVESAPQIRVLGATEYRNTVRDLLGLSSSDTLTQADWTGGFDNGAGIHVDDNLFSALLTEGEALAQRYVATRLAADFPCFDPSALTDGCTRTVISQLGRRAYRRPLTPAQQAELFSFFQEVAGVAGDRRVGLELVVTRLLTSPQFLYRTEVGHFTAPERFELDDFEKASFISYTLTGTMPDEPLLADAEAGRLDDAHLRAHLHRLWATPRARERQAEFFRQWLQVTALDQMARQPADFPTLPSPELGASLKAEFDAYVGAVVFDANGTLPSLFSERFTFVDRHTAPLYGLTSTSALPERVSLDPTQRKGLLTLASTMAAIGSATDAQRDRPVRRGLMVKRQLLCEDIGPPSGVNTVVAAATVTMTPNFDQLTTREQYEAMMQQGDGCRACHRQFMPLGFALGRYDALGRFRTTQGGRPIDAAAADVPFAGEVHAFGGEQDLVDALAASPRTTSCYSRNFVKYALGAAAAPNTQTLSDALLQQLGARPLAIALLVEETLASPHLYVRHGVPEPIADAGVPLSTTVLLLASGESLAPDGARVSGEFTLLNQLDGNLVLYRAGAALWASGTQGSSPGQAAMQGDGNFVVYDGSGQPRFDTGTEGNPGATLQRDAAGQLFLRAVDGRVLWTSGVP